DFGLSKAFSTDKTRCFTNNVVTLWYRSPELLLGERNYGPPIDLWSVGCIMVELWLRTPIFPGATEQGELKLIHNLCGGICKKNWSTVEKLPLFDKLRFFDCPVHSVKERMKIWVKDDLGLDLVDKFLILDPDHRINANDALNHDFFWTDPMPGQLSKVMSTLKISNF
uniref:Protein kinase domain-containing protein n=1 Tax=Strigamia maritima TaxID=126957 RepID=T1IJJ8_STRMM